MGNDLLIEIILNMKIDKLIWSRSFVIVTKKHEISWSFLTFKSDFTVGRGKLITNYYLTCIYEDYFLLTSMKHEY